MWSTLRHFFSFFLFYFFKWNLTLCQIYWIPDIQSLKLVCFIVANTWNRKYADSKVFWTKWLCLSSRTTTCENTSNTGWVLLIFIITFNLIPKGLLMNFKIKQGNFLNYFYGLSKVIECFSTYSWKFSIFNLFSCTAYFNFYFILF